MKNIIKYFIYVIPFLLFSLIGCNGQSVPIAKGAITFNKFPIVEEVVFSTFMPYNQGVARKIFVHDSLLIIANARGTSNYLFSLYNLEKKTFIKGAVPLGGKQGQVLSSISMGLNKNNLWAYDMGANKILSLDLLQPDSTKNSIEIKLPDFYYSVQLKDSLTLLGGGNYKLLKKIQKLDLVSKKIVAEYGDYNDVPSGTPPLAWKKANEAFILLKPSGGKLVTALRYADQIEIFDLKSSASKIIKGPEIFEVAFHAYKMPDKTDMTERTEQTRFAFSAGKVTEKYIYLLYSGNNHHSKHLNYGKKIYVYDWDGNPIKEIVLPNYISSFDIVNDKTLYAFDVESTTLVKSELK